MEYTFAFEKLDVWKNAKDFAIEIYSITKNYPSDERFGMVSQVNRAVMSVVSNIAEGSARKNNKDKAHFYQIAYSSLMEVTSNIIIAKEMGFVSEEKYKTLRLKIQEISNKLNALHKFCLSDLPIGQPNN